MARQLEAQAESVDKRGRPEREPEKQRPTPRVPVRAYMPDCTVTALIELDHGKRLSDLLNASPTVTLYDLHLYALDDGREVTAQEYEVDVGELHAVEALDKPETSRHMHTRTTRVDIDSGPYRILGFIHGPVGADPAHTVIRRPKMIPLTEATLEFEFAGQRVAVESEVVIFNRTLARGLRAADQPVEPVEPETDTPSLGL